ncbi:unnamed protein product [Effrenium voratum]|nr:unnamed protein product [Effrenium voratum]
MELSAVPPRHFFAMGCSSAPMTGPGTRLSEQAARGPEKLSGASLSFCSDTVLWIEHEDLQYQEPRLSFHSTDPRQCAAMTAGGPPMQPTAARHVDRLNRFLKKVDANHACLRGEVLCRRLEV